MLAESPAYGTAASGQHTHGMPLNRIPSLFPTATMVAGKNSDMLKAMTGPTGASSSARRGAASQHRPPLFTPWRSAAPLLGLLLLTLTTLAAPVRADADADPDDASLILPTTGFPPEFIRPKTGSNCTFLNPSAEDAIIAATLDLEPADREESIAIADATDDDKFFVVEVEVAMPWTAVSLMLQLILLTLYSTEAMLPPGPLGYTHLPLSLRSSTTLTAASRWSAWSRRRGSACGAMEAYAWR